MAEYDFHFTAAAMDGIFGEVIEARGAWDTLGERLDNMEQGTGDTYTKTEVDTMLAEKVDKVTGKGLSTNDYTNEEKAQVAANAAGVAAVANAGAKNLLKITATTQTINGVTFTVNADGTIVANGTATANASIQPYRGMPSRDMVGVHTIASGIPEGGSQTTYRGFVQEINNGVYTTIATLTGNEIDMTMRDVPEFRYLITIYSGYTADNLVFKPMIRPAAIEDGTYQPYAPTNRELYEMILALQSGT